MGPPVLYAKSGDIHIAYSVRGSGPDLVWCPGSLSHQELLPQVPEFAGLLDGPARFARVIFFDKRGTGMSDRPAGIPTLEERIDDIRAVMDAAESERAHIFGLSEGGSMACLFAATYPERTRSLILYGTRPRWTRAPDYPWGPTAEEAEADLQMAIANGFKLDFASEAMRTWLGPGLRDDQEFLKSFAHMWRMSATPAARIALSRMNQLIDVRGILASIRVPTLVIAKTGDPLQPPGCAKDLASRIPDARLVELSGEGHLVGRSGPDFIKTLREWVTDVMEAAPGDRFLATILFVDLVRSTERRRAPPKWATALGVTCSRVTTRTPAASSRSTRASRSTRRAMGCSRTSTDPAAPSSAPARSRAPHANSGLRRARGCIPARSSATRRRCAGSRSTPRRVSPRSLPPTRYSCRAQSVTWWPDRAWCSWTAASTN